MARAGAGAGIRVRVRVKVRARRGCAPGFTLIEVLIAMAITAFVAAASYSGIATVLSASERLDESRRRTGDLHRALDLLDRDVRQFVDRPVRDEFGATQPGLSGGPLDFHPLQLTRAGWHNTRELPRSDLQRVYYYLEDGDLWRGYYAVLDRVGNSEPLTVRLLDDVDNFELRFLDRLEDLRISREGVIDTQPWERNWVPDRSRPDAERLPPVAVELRLELADLGTVRRLYVLPLR